MSTHEMKHTPAGLSARDTVVLTVIGLGVATFGAAASGWAWHIMQDAPSAREVLGAALLAVGFLIVVLGVRLTALWALAYLSLALHDSTWGTVSQALLRRWSPTLARNVALSISACAIAGGPLALPAYAEASHISVPVSTPSAAGADLIFVDAAPESPELPDLSWGGRSDPHHTRVPTAQPHIGDHQEPPGTPAEESCSEIIVEAGDSLWSLAEEHQAPHIINDDTTTRTWRAIYEANKERVGPNPDLIHPGLSLCIPDSLPDSSVPSS